MNEKAYRIPAEDIKKLTEGNMGCIASDMITVDGHKVGYMYREEGEDDYDSGWRFFSGEEDQTYADQAEHFSFYKINTIANYDPAFIPYLEMAIGSSLKRKKGTDEFYIIEES